MTQQPKDKSGVRLDSSESLDTWDDVVALHWVYASTVYVSIEEARALHRQLGELLYPSARSLAKAAGREGQEHEPEDAF